jgi:hypothetical protein
MAAAVGCSALVGRPTWVTYRRPLRACGDVTLVGAEPVPDNLSRCLVAGLGGTGAELIVRRRAPSDGLPSDAILRVLPDGTGEFFLHIDPERNAPDSWEWHRCDDVEVTSPDEGVTFSDCERAEPG